jgi:DNA polymerase III epsilon subunit-like protein
MDIMIDLETLGTEPGCVILSIGAVCAEDSESPLSEFYAVVRLQSSVEAGFDVSPDTLLWWFKQDEAARAAVFGEAAMSSALDLRTALKGLDYFISLARPRSVEVWANPASFDLEILKAAYAKVGMPLPWQWHEVRCYRTLKRTLAFVPEDVFSGTKHNALDDARHQMRHLHKMLKAVVPQQ